MNYAYIKDLATESRHMQKGTLGMLPQDPKYFFFLIAFLQVFFFIFLLLKFSSNLYTSNDLCNVQFCKLSEMHTVMQPLSEMRYRIVLITPFPSYSHPVLYLNSWQFLVFFC